MQKTNNWYGLDELKRSSYEWKRNALDFVNENGFTRCTMFSPYVNLNRILENGTFCSAFFGWVEDEIPYIDHGMFYKDPKARKVCLVYIPYQDAEKIYDKVTEWADSRRLKAEIYKDSWYNESTCTVIVTIPDTEVTASMLTPAHN